MDGSNPFSNRSMILNPDEFFGRANELRTIFSRLSNLQSCSVFGERKIGKSSLLHYIFLKFRDEPGADYIAAYIDMQEAKYHTVEGFLKYSLKKLASDPGVIISSNSLNENLIAFSESIEELRKGIKPVLLIDECENMTRRPEFNDDFYDTMRSLGNKGAIAYVTASLHSLKTLCKFGNFTSPFYNLFSDVPLGIFSDEEISEFLSAKREKFEFADNEIEFIKKIAKNQPLRLQIACYYVFENKGKEWDEKKLKKKITKESNHFKDKWSRKFRGIIKYRKDIFIFFKDIMNLMPRLK